MVEIANWAAGVLHAVPQARCYVRMDTVDETLPYNLDLFSLLLDQKAVMLWLEATDKCGVPWVPVLALFYREMEDDCFVKP